LPTVLFA
jgi:DNA-binding XRE family transcriptional regulator